MKISHISTMISCDLMKQKKNYPKLSFNGIPFEPIDNLEFDFQPIDNIEFDINKGIKNISADVTCNPNAVEMLNEFCENLYQEHKQQELKTKLMNKYLTKLIRGKIKRLDTGIYIYMLNPCNESELIIIRKESPIMDCVNFEEWKKSFPDKTQSQIDNMTDYLYQEELKNDRYR